MKAIYQKQTRVGVLLSLVLACSAVAQDSMLIVTNIAQLQAINTSNLSATNATMVLGYWKAGDRGGGVFHWQVGDTTDVPDGGRFLTSSNALSPSGRWQREFIGETANVKMWGAKGNMGDPHTPSNVAAAADDWLPIQTALTNVPTAELLFPAGFYKVTNTLVSDLFRLKIRGESARMTRLVMPLGITKDIFRTKIADAAIAANNGTATDEENIRIEDITFYFATASGTYTQSDHNTNNAGLVICNPEEGTTIRNVGTAGGAYGIRCFWGGVGVSCGFP